jgi:hypothetical protein
MNVILIAHSIIKNFKNPQGDDFQRYTLKLHDNRRRAHPRMVKGVYFANYEEFAVEEKGAQLAKGVSTGARLLYTQRRAAFDAKDRYGVPFSFPINWSEFDQRARQGSDPAVLRADAERKANELDGELKTKALEALVRAGTDTQKLAQLNDWLNGKLNEKSEKEAA